MVGKIPDRAFQRNGEEEENYVNGTEVNGDSRVPISSAHVDINLPSNEMEEKIRDVCKTLVKRWSGLANGNFLVEKVSGGITNLLSKVSAKDEKGETYSVTVRVYGPNTDVIIDRQRELQAIHFLSAAGFGPSLLGIFSNGIVQSFIDAQTLSLTDMRRPKLSAEIARQLRKFHELEVPGSKDPQLWPDIFKLIDKASHVQFEENERQLRYSEISFDNLREEARNLKIITDRLNAPVVFAHNDLLSGNLMLGDGEEKLYLIDFEYSSYSYRGYDIGNHFNEYAGFDCDFSLYPNKESQYHFFRHYLSPEHPELVSEDELQKLYVETNCYALASHLFWGLWAIVQAKYSPIDFDYLGYFFQRYDVYERKKKSCLTLVKACNPNN
eukprot:TRINITY_DN33159_c0_g1_i1.p1 TRINITY_DN33159_c0_g1~~TRINITY_DN33159_c0_g1_i1.p1  ORF type:complete len:383 (-),score=73.11 TRINITY_DN33159_c0_g1_i1:144-1292(-)